MEENERMEAHRMPQSVHVSIDVCPSSQPRRELLSSGGMQAHADHRLTDDTEAHTPQAHASQFTSVFLETSESSAGK